MLHEGFDFRHKKKLMKTSPFYCTFILKLLPIDYCFCLIKIFEIYDFFCSNWEYWGESLGVKFKANYFLFGLKEIERKEKSG